MTSLPTPVKRRLDVACRPCPVRSATPLTEELLLYRSSAMASLRRPSAQTIAVVLALADEPSTWRYGYELVQPTGDRGEPQLVPVTMAVLATPSATSSAGQAPARTDPRPQAAHPGPDAGP